MEKIFKQNVQKKIYPSVSRNVLANQFYIAMCKVRGKNYKTRSALNGHAWTEPGTISTHTFTSRAGGTHKNIRRSDSIRIRFSAELGLGGLAKKYWPRF